MFTIAAFVLGTALLGQHAFDQLDRDELLKNTPYGMDITPDRTAWINMAPVGRRDDYGVRASDFLKRKLPRPTVWIRGYHLRNKDMGARVTMRRVVFDCSSETLAVEAYVAHDASGNVLEQWNNPMASFRMEPAVPNSIGAAWMAFVCRAP